MRIGHISLYPPTPVRLFGTLRSLPLWIGLFLLPLSGFGQSGPVWIFHYENDVFSGTDRYYTNGVLFRYLSPESSAGEGDGLGAFLDQKLPFSLPAAGSMTNTSWAVGQSMFTPREISVSELLPDDRPYAGWLYGRFGFQRKTFQRLETWELTVGVVGPSSAADEVQAWVHENIAAGDDPKGWKNQLRDEPAAMITYRRVERHRLLGEENGFVVEALPEFGFSAGNVRVAAQAALGLRAGWNLAADFGPSLIRPGGGTAVPATNGAMAHTWSFALFADLAGEAVAHDIFLAGNTWKESHSVEIEPWVGELRLGFQIGWASWRLAYTHVQMTKVFEAQRQRQSYGSLSLARYF